MGEGTLTCLRSSESGETEFCLVKRVMVWETRTVESRGTWGEPVIWWKCSDGKLYHRHEILLRVLLLVDALCSWVFPLEMGRSSKVKLQWNHWGMAEPAMYSHPFLVPLRVSISIYICDNFPILSSMLVTVCMFDLGRRWLRTMWVRVQLISRVRGGSWALGGFKSPLSRMWTKCFGQRERVRRSWTCRHLTSSLYFHSLCPGRLVPLCFLVPLASFIGSGPNDSVCSQHSTRLSVVMRPLFREGHKMKN